ncbi:MAG: RNA polymerase sigma-54 factor, partial [Nitrospinota bacterium]
PAHGHKYSQEQVDYVTPDLYIVKVDDEYQVYLNDDGIPSLKISPVYLAVLKNKEFKNSGQKEAHEFLDSKYHSAQWMINSIEQRRQTMLKFGRSICKFQQGFLDNGIDHLKPLVLRDIADDIGMHESTISRVTTNKYIQTPQGLFELKFFFHSTVPSFLGSDMSSVRVKEIIKQLIKAEDELKPLTDDQIVKKLQIKNVNIARRTVTKYRKALQIPSTSKRRKINI